MITMIDIHRNRLISRFDGGDAHVATDEEFGDLDHVLK